MISLSLTSHSLTTCLVNYLGPIGEPSRTNPCLLSTLTCLCRGSLNVKVAMSLLHTVVLQSSGLLTVSWVLRWSPLAGPMRLMMSITVCSCSTVPTKTESSKKDPFTSSWGSSVWMVTITSWNTREKRSPASGSPWWKPLSDHTTSAP